MSDTLNEILAASRTWLDRAADAANAGEVSKSAAYTRVGSGYATLAAAHAAAAPLSATERARTEEPARTAVPLPLQTEAFPSALRPAPVAAAS